MEGLGQEAARKAVHLASLAIPAVYLSFGRGATLTFLAYCLVLFLAAEYVRIELGVKIPFFDAIAREHEGERMGAEMYFTLGAMVAFAVYAEAVAVAVVLMASLGDMAASLVGKAAGGPRLRGRKTLSGAAGELAVDVAAVLGFGALFPSVALPASVVLVMGVAATAVETAVERIDDNLAIPIFAGLVGNLALGAG